MKPDTDKYEQMKKKGNQKDVKIKERKKNDIAMLEEIRRQKREQRRYRAKQKTKKQRKKERKKERKAICCIL